MRRCRLIERLGFKYIANHRTKEIHRVEHLTSRCRINLLKRSGYCTRWWQEKLLRKGYNGCRYCYKEKDSDRR
jgi:hypothetical protein